MKLLYCHWCGDIFNLTFKDKKCSCGNASGKYLEHTPEGELDGLNAEYSPKGVAIMPFMINSNDFKIAFTEWSSSPAKQIEFPMRACSIPMECKTLKIVPR